MFDEHERARQLAVKLLVDPAEKQLFQMAFRMGDRDEKVDLFFSFLFF